MRRSSQAIISTAATLMLLFGSLFCPFASHADKPELASGRVAYMMGGVSSGPLDESTIRFIADRAGVVVLGFPLLGQGNEPDYSALVKRFHELKPGLPILMGCWLVSWYNVEGIASSVLEGYQFQPLLGIDKFFPGRWLNPPYGRCFFGDITDSSHGSWLLDRLQTFMKTTGADGLAIDNLAYSPPDSMLGWGQKFPPNYSQTLEKLVSKLFKLAGKDKLLIYNGLEAWDYQRSAFDFAGIKDQLKLLPYFDGGVAEWFGMHPSRKVVHPFKETIAADFKAIESNPDKIALVYGRGTWQYSDYKDDYLWQRYLYCTYLLVAGPKTRFKYHASFVVPPHAGRSGGLDYYADWDIDIGEPMGHYYEKDGLYCRNFSKGLIAVAPHDGAGGQLFVDRPLVSPEGLRVAGKVPIAPGQGFILLEPRHSDKAQGQDDLKLHQKIRLNGLKARAHVTAPVPPDGPILQSNGVAEILLNMNRQLTCYTRIKLRARTSDPKAVIHLKCEVDDTKKQFPFAILVVGGPEAKPTLGRNLHYGIDIVRHSRLTGQVPFIPMAIDWKKTGSWQDFIIDQSQLAQVDGRYSLRRFVHARIEGKVDIGDITLANGDQD